MSETQALLDANETIADLAKRVAEQTGAFNSTEVVSISGRDLAAFDGRLCS